MDYLYNLLQTGAIISHLVIIILKVSFFKKTTNFVIALGVTIQVVLIVFLTRDLANQWIVNKEWIWYLMDYLLALYFYLNLKNNQKSLKS